MKGVKGGRAAGSREERTMPESSATGRRQLRFQSLDEVLEDARRLAAGPVVQRGNWTLGQVCRHLAQGMVLSIDGPARPLTYPWWHCWLGPLFRGWVLRYGLRPGYELGGSAAEQ